MTRQQTPWEIGRTYYDQTDLYTRDANIDATGYAVGPHHHPEEGSYAYRREQEHPPVLSVGDATQYEREAWPWLNYRGPHDEPYFSHLHDHGGSRWSRFRRMVKMQVMRILWRGAEERRIDHRIRIDVARAFDFRADLDSSDIRVIVNRARVTLEGSVPDLRARELAEETTAGIRGVEEVVNHLTIKPEDPTATTPLFVGA
jgi:hypothetical protein